MLTIAILLSLHYSPSNYLFYNCKFILLTTFLQFSLPPPLASGKHKADFFCYEFWNFQNFSVVLNNSKFPDFFFFFFLRGRDSHYSYTLEIMWCSWNASLYISLKKGQWHYSKIILQLKKKYKYFNRYLLWLNT